MPLSFGGPYVGLFATRDKYARQIPGRLVGEAYDTERPSRFRADARNARAAHSPRESDFEHLHERRTDCAGRHDLSGDDGSAAACRKSRSSARKKPIMRRARSRRSKAFRFPSPDRSSMNLWCARRQTRRRLLEKLASEKGIDGGIALSRFDTDRPNDFLVCVTET